MSILIAAVFVRLAREMPTLDWKSVPPARRRQVTSSLVAVSVEYAQLLAFISAVLLAVIVLVGAGPDLLGAAVWSGMNVATGAAGFVFGLVPVRMAFVVWRDLDIVRLQKKVVDDMADADELSAQGDIAAEKVDLMRAMMVRGQATAPPEQWRA